MRQGWARQRGHNGLRNVWTKPRPEYEPNDLLGGKIAQRWKDVGREN